VGRLRVLDPLNEPGRVTLITRYGSKKIRQYLPAHIKAVQAAGLKVGSFALNTYRLLLKLAKSRTLNSLN
jgi:3-deoxy-D-arabino-heptulosonate 7-phosphate (DAHP) synthase class II